MSFSRRTFLFYVGAAVGVTACGPRWLPTGPDKTGKPSDAWRFTPVPYPVPLPRSECTEGSIRERFSFYTVRDQLSLPPEFTFKVLAKWGDVVGPEDSPDKQIRFGYNCDYTSLIPRKRYDGEFWLCVNHEYVSLRPWSQGYKDVYGVSLPELTVVPGTKEIVVSGAGEPLTTVRSIDLSSVLDSHSASYESARKAAHAISSAILEEMGVSILHARLGSSGELAVITESPFHKRITTTTYHNCGGAKPPRMSGPVSHLVTTVHGTACNCSGGYTPWGTMLTCEENFQDMVAEYVTPEGVAFPQPPFSAEGKGEVLSLPVGWEGAGGGSKVPLDSRSYGWVTEIDPETGTLVKHSSLGRFRHENITLNVKEGAPLIAYMGDDRRGGHVWRFQSEERVSNLTDPQNTKLFEKGTLYVAKFNPDYTGKWIPLEPETKLVVPSPEYMASGEMMLPNRPEGGAVVVSAAPKGGYGVWVKSYIKKIEQFTGKSFSEVTLGDLVSVPSSYQGDPREFQRAVILMDAHRMANAVGGTPCARPEDLEYDHRDDGVFIAFTEASGSRDGSPDTRIFVDSKGDTSRQYGAIFRIYDEPNNAFHWQKLAASGEVADGGGGFACADNLALDGAGNLWAVCDITTQVSNVTVTREGKSAPGTKEFMGIFGNSSIFRFHRTENGIGFPECFAVGPMECELTGPTFLPDDKGLILSVQHPGEHNGAFTGIVERRTQALSLPDGEIVKQERDVPLGSNFPHGVQGKAPRPAVVVITRE